MPSWARPTTTGGRVPALTEVAGAPPGRRRPVPPPGRCARRSRSPTPGFVPLEDLRIARGLDVAQQSRPAIPELSFAARRPGRPAPVAPRRPGRAPSSPPARATAAAGTARSASGVRQSNSSAARRGCTPRGPACRTSAPGPGRSARWIGPMLLQWVLSGGLPLQGAPAVGRREAVGGVVPAEDLPQPRPDRVALPVPGELVGVDQPPRGDGADDHPRQEAVARPDSRRPRVDSQSRRRRS